MSSEPKPNETLARAVTELSTVTAQLVRRIRAETGSHDLGWSVVAIMSRLTEAGALTTAELARLECMTPQSMGAILAQMEQQTLVERRPHPTDGRQILFALTAAGIETRHKLRLAKRTWMVAAMAKLTPAEQQTLIRAAALIRQMVES